MLFQWPPDCICTNACSWHHCHTSWEPELHFVQVWCALDNMAAGMVALAQGVLQNIQLPASGTEVRLFVWSSSAENGALIVLDPARAANPLKSSADPGDVLLAVPSGTAVGIPLLHKCLCRQLLLLVSRRHQPPASVQVILDSQLWHRSLPNLSDQLRRAWMPQFSASAMRRPREDQPVALAVPLGAMQM